MADYLIELGARRGGETMLANAPRSSLSGAIASYLGSPQGGAYEARVRAELGLLRSLGQEGGGIFTTLLGFLSDAIGVLADVVGFPTGLIAEGVDFVLGGLAELAKEIPIVGSLISDILVAANTVLGAGLSLPSETLKLVGNLLKVFDKLPDDQQEELKKKSEEKIQAKAAESGQANDVRQAQDVSRDVERQARADDTLKTIAAVGAPTAFGALVGALIGVATGNPVIGILAGASATGVGIGVSAAVGGFAPSEAPGASVATATK